MSLILVINPGSTSTKLAVFDGEECRIRYTIEHSLTELAEYRDVLEQADFRQRQVVQFVQNQGFSPEDFSALAVRGGILRPLPGGVYRVDERMVDDLSTGRYGRHASNLGGMIGLTLGREWNVPAYTVDPVVVDEMEEVARYSGLAGIPRLSRSHALNSRAVARKVALDLGRSYETVNLIVAHLGGGVSVSAHRQGRMIDVNNAQSEGPFSLERTGTLPVLAVIDLCFEGQYTREALYGLMTERGGLFSYLGTKDFREVEERISAGEGKAQEIVEALAYQVGKEIGAMAAVLVGQVDRVLLTGGLAHSRLLTDLIAERVAFIAPLVVVPGEHEMEALASGALSVLQGHETARIYGEA